MSYKRVLAKFKGEIMLTTDEKYELRGLAEDLQFMCESRGKLRRKIFKILRMDMETLKETNPWTYGKMMRGYANEVKDDQLVSACKTFIERSSRRELVHG